MDVRFELSAYEYTIVDPPCVKVIRGHPRSSEVTDLGLPLMTLGEKVIKGNPRSVTSDDLGLPLMTFSPKVKIRVI